VRQRPYREGHHISEVGVRIMAQAFEEAVMKLDGIEAFVLPAGVAEAAVEDGRPYQLFLAELLRLGLDQHLQRRARNSQPLT
jgi:hypothetical protein